MKTFLWICLFIPMIWGCQARDSGPHRVRIFGSASFNGQPIEKGMIHFIPVGDSSGDLSGGDIHNGSYNITNKGGVLPGEYRIEFTARRSIPPITLEDGSVMDYEQYLPEKFNSGSSIVLVVPEDASTLEQDYDLKE